MRWFQRYIYKPLYLGRYVNKTTIKDFGNAAAARAFYKYFCKMQKSKKETLQSIQLKELIQMIYLFVCFKQFFIVIKIIKVVMKMWRQNGCLASTASGGWV